MKNQLAALAAATVIAGALVTGVSTPAAATTYGAVSLEKTSQLHAAAWKKSRYFLSRSTCRHWRSVYYNRGYEVTGCVSYIDQWYFAYRPRAS